MFHIDRYIDIMNSGKRRKGWVGAKAHLCHPIRSMEDRRVLELIETMQFFDAWHAENEALEAQSSVHRRERFITDELYYDIGLAIRGFVAHCSRVLSSGEDGPEAHVLPRLFNQDCVEGHFSLLRAAGGAQVHTNAVDLSARQAAASMQTDKGGIGIGSSGTQKNNVSENHSEVEHELTIEIKNRAQTRKARQARLHTGREIAAKGGIPY